VIAVCLAGGPSLTPADVEACRPFFTLAINNSIDLAPWADVCFAADFSWWDARQGLPDYGGWRVGMEPWSRADPGKYPAVTRFGNAGPVGLSLEPTRLCTGQNSGYAAINLAVLCGATTILLLGYDMQPGVDGTHHWHPAHPGDRHPNYRRCIAAFETLKEPLTQRGVVVYNCSSESAITAFAKRPLREALHAENFDCDPLSGTRCSPATRDSIVPRPNRS
jgi:hypothetical protein